MANSLLKFVKFKEVTNWSPHYLINADIGFLKRFPLVKISMFLKKNKMQTEIKDSESYRRVTIRMNNNGVLLRDTVDGKQIGTKRQFVIKGGQFLVSKIDARNGAFGVAPDSLDGAIVTADFLSFNIDKSLINPLFLELLTSTKQFIDYCQGESSGTTGRQRINESTFLNISVPLPPLNEQSRIVEMFYSKYNKAQKLEEEATRLESSIETYLQKELGIEIVENKKDEKGLRFVKFSEIERWDALSIDLNCYAFLRKSKYPVKTLENSFEFTSRKWEKDENKRIYEYIEIGSIDPLLGIIQTTKIDAKKPPSRATQVVKTNDLIIGMTRPYLKKFAIVKKELDGSICSSGFSIIKASEKYDVRFILEYLMSWISTEQFKNKMTGALYPAITMEQLKTIILPLPPLSVQIKIADTISKVKDQVKSLRSDAEKLRVDAKETFTKELFS